MTVIVNNLTPEPVNGRGIGRLINNVLSAENVKGNRDVAVTIVGIIRMKKINREYRRRNSPTDVLTFNEPDESWPKSEKNIKLGEIIICPAVVKSNAKRFGVEYPEEFKRVVIHGLLHLLGYNHFSNMAKSGENIYIYQEEYLKTAGRLRLINN